MYQEAKVEIQNNMFNKGVKQVLDDTVKTDKKSQVRYRIENEVFDLEDSVADNAKMISLLITLVSRMYDTYTTTQKNRLSTADRQLIEYTFGVFANTETRGDVQFTQEGSAMIDKILTRQASVGVIVK